jgi:hypothetical protein
MGKIKKPFSSRIHIKEEDDLLEVSISGRIPSFQFSLLSIWLVGWTIAGILVLIQYFNVNDQNTRLFMLVWFAFWIYFEYRITFAWLWRRSGCERIVFRPDKIEISNEMNGKSKSNFFNTSNVNGVKNLEQEQGLFVKNYHASFWVVGGETIGFYDQGKLHSFARQLSQEEANQLTKKINYKLEYWQKTDQTQSQEN